MTCCRRKWLELLQLRVFGFGSLQEREVGIGVLPKIQECRQRLEGFQFVTTR